MNKFTVALLDADREYVEMLTSYINGEESLQTRVSGWTELEGLTDALRQSPAHILAYHASFAGALPPLPPNCLPVMLTDGTETGGQERPETEQGEAAAKFQPIRSLVARLKDLYASQHVYPAPGTDEAARTSVLAVYSAVGDAGKTTVSLQLARQLARMGKKVLWLSLESLPCPLLPDTDPTRTHAFSRLLYLLKTDIRTVAGKWPSLVSTEFASGLDFVKPPDEPVEMLEMTQEDTFKLIAAVRELGLYDYVLLDLDSSLCDRTAAAMRASSRIWWLVTDSDSCLRKTAMMLRMRHGAMADAITDKETAIRFVLNKGSRGSGLDADSYGIPICGRLSYQEKRDEGGQWREQLAEEALGLFFMLEEGDRPWERRGPYTN